MMNQTMMGARPGRQVSGVSPGAGGADNFSQESPRPVDNTPRTAFQHSVWRATTPPPQAGAENPHYAGGLAGLAQDSQMAAAAAAESRLQNQMLHQEESMVIRIKAAKRNQHRTRMLTAILGDANPSPGSRPEDVYAPHSERISAQLQRYSAEGAYDPSPRPPLHLPTASAKELLMRNMDIEQEAVVMEKEVQILEVRSFLIIIKLLC